MSPPDQVRAQVDRILASPWFAGAERRGKLLRYLVEQALAGDRGAVKESVLAAEVFDRGSEYDSRIDSLVRMEVGRLRSKLAEYYVNAGQRDAVRIEIPKGSYLPQITGAGEESSPSAPVPAAPSLPAPERRWVLPRILFAVLALMALAVTLLLWWNRPRHTAEPPSVAILPFLNLTGSPDQEFLSDSITDELTEVLAETRGIRVVARTSAFQFKGKASDIREIGRRLNVSALIEGSVERADDRLELVVQLIRTSDGYHVWSKTFLAADKDLRGVESDIAGATRRVLLPGDTGAGTDSRGTSNPEAHDLYLQAAYLFHKGDHESLRKALDLARRAVSLDPAFVRAHWLIVKSEQNLAARSAQSMGEAEARSADSWQAILALDPASADTHTQMAFRAYVRDWDWPKAEAEFRLALASGGSHGNAHNLYGWCLMTRGRFVEAHQHLDAALEIDPMVQVGARANSAIAWMMERKYANAKRVIASMYQLNPQSGPAYQLLSWILLAEGDCVEARAQQRKGPPGSEPVIPDAKLEAECGSPDAARRKLAELMDGKHYFSPFDVAETYSLLGDADSAIDFLNKAAETKSDVILYLGVDPLLDRVRKDPRVQALAARIGLPSRVSP